MVFCAKKPPQKCNCCEKKLKKSDRNKKKGSWKKKFRQCDRCKGKVCYSCGLNNICHECMIKESIVLDPDVLMQTDRKELLKYLNTLHCTDYEFQTLDSKFLVKQILMRYRAHEEWDPNIIDFSPPILRRSRIQQELADQPKPQPAKRTATKKHNDTAQQPEMPHLDIVKVPSVLPLGDIKSAEYFDTLSVPELKYFLQENSISSVNIYDKQHLKRIAIELWRKFCQNQIRTSSMHQYNRSMSKAPVPRQRTPKNQIPEQPLQHRQPSRFVRSPSLRNISSEEEIDMLTLEELIIILHKYNINPHYYKNAIEMANQVKMLWSSLIRKPAYQPNESGKIHYQDVPTQDVHQKNQHQKSTGPLFQNHEIPHQPLENKHSNHMTAKQPVEYANYSTEAHPRSGHSGSRRALYPEIEAINGNLGLHPATFVPEVHHIPLQTVEREYLPPEPVTLEGIVRAEEIEALGSQELVDLLDQHNISYNQESRGNKRHLVEMVTRLWLGNKRREAMIHEAASRSGSSMRGNAVPFAEMAQPRTQVGTTDVTFHGHVPHNKRDISLLDISSPDDIQELSNGQLKYILKNNKINPTYYTEREELVLQVRLLWEREQKQKIEGKTVDKNMALMDQYYKERKSSIPKTAEVMHKSDSIKQNEEMRRSFFRDQLPPPVPSPRASLQRETVNKSKDEMQKINHQIQEQQSQRRPHGKPPAPPIRDYATTITALPEATKMVEVQMARIEPFTVRQDSTISLSPHLPVKPYVPVYPREREISRSQSTGSEKELKVQHIRKISKNVSLRDIRALEEIQDMPLRDIRILLEKYDVEIYPGAEKGHLIELVTKLWDKRQTQGLGLVNKNRQSRERSRSTRQNSSDVVYAEIIHVSNSSVQKAKVRSTEQLHLDPESAVTKINDFLAINTSMVQSLQDISSPDIIDKLTIRQIKSILSKHAVDFSTCTEKKEMADCLRNLWHDERNNETANMGGTSKHFNKCWVCKRRDQAPDCVFLNCGHMIMCMDCGSKTKECPKCRQYIVRVVRVFKS